MENKFKINEVVCGVTYKQREAYLVGGKIISIRIERDTIWYVLSDGSYVEEEALTNKISEFKIKTLFILDERISKIKDALDSQVNFLIEEARMKDGQA